MRKDSKIRSIRIILVTYLWLSLPLACTNQNPGSTDSNSKTRETPQDSQACDSTNCSEPFSQQDSQSGVPNFDNANLDSRFNRSKLKKQSIPDEYKTRAIIGKQSHNYRAIWLDLRKEAWAGFGAFSERFGNGVRRAVGDKAVAEYLGEIFDAPKEADNKKISIYQPLQNYSILPFDDEPLQFYLVGHLAHPGLTHPNGGTLVLTPSPYLENNDASLAPPVDYELVFEKEGIYTEDILAKCSKMFADLSAGKLLVPPIELNTQCETILPGIIMGSYNQTTGTYNNAFDELFKKQSVAIWKPVPQEGYKCLGFVATNGKNEKPFTERDFAQSVVDMRVGERYAMYCLQEKLVTKGKLLLPPIATDGEVTLFTISNETSEGYGEGNMFFAFKGEPNAEALSKVEVWVPKISVLNVIEDN